ncbi:defender against apopototic cell death 1 [Salpingoeca rosetta]|uniref:Dolichyl-diphosphooligosaccharide--protein glycosyltransferase subunit OST2 n=1 Tax=Salpingoeca rosetta (strain ATCC 50818 / BSB-021) TaxID=946362 RepID=F2UP10_SALR5|nr:defender against apopototic cell death 1 [Salpingoeca rosetta]EGD79365.1 defender against apopototic cell death 1 [Salpingoeca rosetta]|eukprot:XP_004989134.1 defender against apopototic cell death 1 [Salpingoeca rosetta]
MAKGNSGGSNSGSSKAVAGVGAVVGNLWKAYQSTPKTLKIIDAYLFYILLTGLIQFVYCALVGTFPFNSFLSGFISSVGSFVLAACLRSQVNPENAQEFSAITREQAFADFIFGHLILHLVVVNFMG